MDNTLNTNPLLKVDECAISIDICSEYQNNNNLTNNFIIQQEQQP